MSRITVGSRAFFSCYEDFEPHDADELEFVDNEEIKEMCQIIGQGRCHFLMRRRATTQEYIDYALSCNLGMVIGKFLVPEFAATIGLSVADLSQLSPLLKKLDEKHLYEKIIFDSYIQNKAFTLTDEQRAAAYESYKATRKK